MRGDKWRVNGLPAACVEVGPLAMGNITQVILPCIRRDGIEAVQTVESRFCLSRKFISLGRTCLREERTSRAEERDAKKQEGKKCEKAGRTLQKRLHYGKLSPLQKYTKMCGAADDDLLLFGLLLNVLDVSSLQGVEEREILHFAALRSGRQLLYRVASDQQENHSRRSVRRGS